MRGFVLVEVVIVVAIIAIIFFSLIPVYTSDPKKNANEDLSKLNTLIKEALALAREKARPIKIWGVKGVNTIHIEDIKKINFNYEVFEAKINDDTTVGIEYNFFVYPQQVMDKVVLTFSNYEKFVSNPILLRFDIEK